MQDYEQTLKCSASCGRKSVHRRAEMIADKLADIREKLHLRCFIERQQDGSLQRG